MIGYKILQSCPTDVQRCKVATRRIAVLIVVCVGSFKNYAKVGVGENVQTLRQTVTKNIGVEGCTLLSLHNAKNFMR